MYEQSSLVSLAAKTVYSLATNHPFVDGNKRIAYIAMRLFLRLNGYDLNASQEDKINLMLEIAASKHTTASIELWLESHVVAISS